MIWIIIAILVALILYIWLKPYFIKDANTICFTGQMGTGKTYLAVDKAVKKIKKARFDVKLHNLWTKFLNKIIAKHNKNILHRANKGRKHTGKTWQKRELQQLPRLLSNIPIRIKGGKHKEWSNVLQKEMLTFERLEQELIKLPENSIILTDELPQLVDQFNWNLDKVQNNLNEFITFIRHYFNGTLIITAQSIDQVVKPIRQKMNTFYFLTNWRRFLHFFYKVDTCQFMTTELVTNFSQAFVEDNTKTVYGILHKHRYESRCYAPRYQDLPDNQKYKFKQWHKYTTKRIIRFDDYHSPLDPKDTTNNG